MFLWFGLPSWCIVWAFQLEMGICFFSRVAFLLGVAVDVISRSVGRPSLGFGGMLLLRTMLGLLGVGLGHSCLEVGLSVCH